MPRVTRATEAGLGQAKAEGLPNVMQTAKGATPDAFGAGVGRAVAGLGRSVSRVGSVLADQVIFEKKQETEALAKDADTAFANEVRIILHDPENGYYSRTGKNAVDAFDVVERELKSKKQFQEKRIKSNQTARNLFSGVADKRIERTLDAMARHKTIEQGRWADETANARIASLTDDASAGYNDDSIIQQSIGAAMDEVVATAERKGWGQDKTAQEAARILDGFHTAVVNRASIEDVAFARGYFERKRGEISEAQEVRIERFLRASEEDQKRKYDAAARELQKLQKQAHARLVSDLEISVSRGDAGPVEIEEARNAGWLPENKYVSLVKNADKRENDEQKAQEDIGRVVLMLEGEGAVFDSKSNDDRKAVETYFERVLAPSLEGMEPIGRLQTVTDFIARSGIVPERIESAMRSALRMGGEQEQLKAADFVSRLQEKNPMLLNGFDKQELRKAQHISGLVRSGVKGARAVGLANEALAVDAPERQVRASRIKQDKLLDNAESVLGNEMGGGFFGFGEATVSDALIGEYRALFTENFISTGDKDIAKEQSLQELHQVWSVTDIDGEKRLMKYPPERYGLAQLSDDDNAKWMRRQLIDDLIEAGAIKNEDGFEGFRIIADVRTARELPAPSWSIMQIKDGLPSPLMVNGQPMRWRPDWASSTARIDLEAAIERRKKKAIKRARMVRSGAIEPPPNEALPLALQDWSR